MRYEAETPDGTRVRIVIDPDAPAHAYLMTLPPGDHATWSRPLELTAKEAT